MDTIGKRLKYIIDKKGLNPNKIAKNTSIHPTTIKNYIEDLTRPDNLKLDIVSKYLDVNIDWLLTGEGEMIINNKEEEEYKNSYSKLKQLNTYIKKEGSIPYYDIDITGSITGSFSDIKEKPKYYIDLQPLNDCDASFTIRGDSMYPKYVSGQILVVKTVKNYNAILWGEAYLIITNSEANDLKTVKLIFPHEDFDKIILRASNPNFKGDTVIEKKDVISMHLVKGNINIGHM